MQSMQIRQIEIQGPSFPVAICAPTLVVYTPPIPDTVTCVRLIGINYKNKLRTHEKH